MSTQPTTDTEMRLLKAVNFNTNYALMDAAKEIDALAMQLRVLQSPVTWSQQDYEDGDTWRCSGCGTKSVWEYTPEESGLKFCSFCGHPVEFEKYEDPKEDEEE
jgi:hypothetical protein